MADPLYIDSSGAVVPVSPDQLDGAAQLGWVPASPKQASDFALQQKYGTTPEAVKAFGEHAASALTLGLSDVAERHLGVDPAAMRAREAANPIASGAGTAAGVVAGLAIPGLGEASGPALVAKAGTRTAEAVRGSLPAGLLAKAAAAGAGSAVEGAAYGLGQVVHEAALGDPNLTAQSALATVGLSAALGGALGGAGGVLGHALGEGARAMPDWLSRVEGERNIKAAGGIQSDIARIVKQKGRPNLQAIGREGGELGLVGPMSTPESTAEKAQALLTQTGQEMGNLLAKSDAAEPIDGLLARAKKDILTPLASNPLQQPAAKQFAAALDGYAQKFADGATLTDLHGMRREVSDALYGLRGNMDPFANSYKDALHDFRSLVSRELDAGVEKAGVPAGDWRALNRRYEVGSVFADLAEKGMNRAHGNNLVSPAELLSAVGGGATLGAAGALASGAGAALLRRHASGMLGAAARSLREAIGPEAVESVVNKTADAISAQRSLGVADLSADAGAGLARQLDALNLANPGSAGGGLSESTQARLVQELGKLNVATPAEVSAAGPGLSDRAKKALLGQLGDLNLVNPSDSALAGLSPEARAKLESQFSALNIRPDSSVGPTARIHAAAPPLPAPAISSSPEKVATLSLLERLNQQAQRKIETGISTLVRGGPRAANIGRGEISAGVASVFGHSAEDARAGFTKRTEQIRGLAGDPALLQDKLTQQTDDWHEHAPNTAQALQVTTARAVAFLASKLPASGKAGPLAQTPTPSRSEISKFNRYYEAVQNPSSILKQAAAGTLTPEAVEAVQAVYPDLFNAIRAAAVAKMAGARNVPYRSRLMLSILLGQDTDGTTLPFSLMRNRAVFAKPLAAPQMPKATPARADKLTMADRLKTPMQANRSRP